MKDQMKDKFKKPKRERIALQMDDEMSELLRDIKKHIKDDVGTSEIVRECFKMGAYKFFKELKK